MRRRGFTLIELLVVIAIIGVLVALLAARLSRRRVRQAAGSVHEQPQADRPGLAQLRASQHQTTVRHGR